MNRDPAQLIQQLDYWRGDISLEPVGGGITNRNYVVTDQGRRYSCAWEMISPARGDALQ